MLLVSNNIPATYRRYHSGINSHYDVCTAKMMDLLRRCHRNTTQAHNQELPLGVHKSEARGLGTALGPSGPGMGGQGVTPPPSAVQCF